MDVFFPWTWLCKLQAVLSGLSPSWIYGLEALALVILLLGLLVGLIAEMLTVEIDLTLRRHFDDLDDTGDLD